MSQKDEKARMTKFHVAAAPENGFTVEDVWRAQVAGAACGCLGLPAAILGYQRHLRAEPAARCILLAPVLVYM